MTSAINKLLNREWPLVIKLLIIGLALMFIYKKVIVKDDLDEFLIYYRELASDSSNLLPFLAVDMLMGINWYLEACKWRFLIRKFHHISIFRSLRAVLSGVTVSFFLPNRIGEFAGRVLHVDPGFRFKSVLATFIGNASQLMITCIAGLFGLVFFVPHWLALSAGYSWILLAAAILVTVLLLNMYFHFAFLTKVLHHLRVLHRFEKYLEIFAQYSRMELLRILMYSVLRYLVFSIQFIMLLRMMGVQTDLLLLAGLISVVYLVLTVVPTIAITELPVRGSVTLYIIGQYSQEHLAILCATFTLWVINLVIPSILGSVSVLYFRFTK